jgi:peptidoglycan/LPS O-acetylase OafA/YrhL
MGEIKSLTSLRGVFAMWVVFFHLHAWSDIADQPLLFIDRGYLGVDFFFLLSGFILAGRHAREFVDG